LTLSDIDVYVYDPDSSAFTHLNALFAAGTDSVPWGDGFLVLESDWLAGDFDGNRVYDCHDINLLTSAIRNTPNEPGFDLTADGQVTVSDLQAWLTQAGTTQSPAGTAYLPGDANLDGYVDVQDFNLWNSHKFTSTPFWCNGDFNADGMVDQNDLAILQASMFRESANLAPAVPEPQTLLFGLSAMLFGAGTLRKRLSD
jgi:hypothetical protein